MAIYDQRRTAQEMTVMPPPTTDNYLDVVYDIIADCSAGHGEWINMEQVTSMAEYYANMPKELVLDAIEMWEGLAVLTRSADSTRVKFQGDVATLAAASSRRRASECE